MKRKWLGLVLVGAMLGLALWAYPRLPEQIPTHWNVQGEVDDWGHRGIVLLVPGIALLMWLLMLGLRRIDPRREHYAQFEPTFWLIVDAIIAFLAVVHTMMVGAALGWPMPAVDVLMPVALGVFFMVLGNFMPRVRSNWWMGVRTPWTLSSERVWRSTHRLAGRTFMAGGLLLIASVLLPPGARVVALGVAITLSALVPAVWSYLAWRREQQHAGPSD